MLSQKVADAWLAPADVKAVDWIPANVRMPSETETPGPFDLDMFPHVSGVLEAFDDSMVRNIYMPWAARVAKTITGLAALMHFGKNYPRPSMLARETEERVNDLCESQFYPLLEACDDLRKQLKPEHKRKKRSIDLARCRIRRAYSGAPSSMAGFPACYALASEISKWSKKRSSEADPIYLFKKRGMLYPFDSKFLFESTPAEINNCNITTLCSAAGVDVRRRLVPCPLCGTFQELRFGDKKDDSPGIKWDKNKAGRSDPIRAEETAWYQCENGCRIENADRPEMMRAGVWLSKGQQINKAGKITGKPVCVSSTVAFGHPLDHPFSALHSLMISGWGQIAREFLEVQGNREGLREFINQTLGMVWDPAPVTVKPHELEVRLGVDELMRVCPQWSVFTTLATDVGRIGEELIFYWWVDAWGPNERGQLIDYGIIGSEKEYLALIQKAEYPHADGGTPLRPVRFGADSGEGHVSNRIYTIMEGIPNAWPMKGSSYSGFPDVYQLAFQRTDLPPKLVAAKRKLGLGDIIMQNTQRSQERVEDILTGVIKRDDPGFYSIPREAFRADPDLAEQLLNEYAIDERTEKGRSVCSWIKKGDNEWRDTARMSWALAWHYTRNGQLWPHITRSAETEPKQRKTDSSKAPSNRRSIKRRRMTRR